VVFLILSVTAPYLSVRGVQCQVMELDRHGVIDIQALAAVDPFLAENVRYRLGLSLASGPANRVRFVSLVAAGVLLLNTFCVWYLVLRPLKMKRESVLTGEQCGQDDESEA